MKIWISNRDKTYENKFFVENKIELPDSKDAEEMNKIGLKKISSKRKGERFMDIINTSLKNQKYIRIKK